ncbi:hypothetical protein LTR66_010852 [Elasticomyces elasticus]|nr:hypothetical protein LTR66_010852 [Elasticomyces elasticus]
MSEDMDSEQKHMQHSNYQQAHNQWPNPAPYPHSYHGTPVHEYTGFTFSPPYIPMEPRYTGNMQPPRTTHQQLQPLVMPQWPSMLSNQAHIVPQILPTAPVPIMPLLTPVSASSNRSSIAPTPRKTLTDADRREMCLFHKKYPTMKQTEIGAHFGVERSTVSKVLGKIDKYLYQDDGRSSPIKRPRGNPPDIERTLTKWAQAQQKKGVKLSDENIKERYLYFAAGIGSSEVPSTSWIEKFKQKYNLLDEKRRGSLAIVPECDSDAVSSSHASSGRSPTSPNGTESSSPSESATQHSRDPIKMDSPDTFFDFSSIPRPFHSQSSTPLSSHFTDTVPSSFSPGPLSPTSPFFTPDSATAPSPFIPQPSHGPQLLIPAGSNTQRPRSQTVPLLENCSELSTPKYLPVMALDSPMEEAKHPLGTTNLTMRRQPPTLVERLHTVSPAETMHPPPLPTARKIESSPMSAGLGLLGLSSTLAEGPSQEEAREALQVLVKFFERQPSGYLDLQESVTLGKLLEKLRLQNNAS